MRPNQRLSFISDLINQNNVKHTLKITIMKKNILFLTAIFLTVTALDAQIVALHQTGGVKLFNGTNAFASACNTAVAGDTIYLTGNGFDANVILDKKLFIYGTGHYVDSTSATGKTTLAGNITLNENADGFHLEGITLTGKVSTTYNHSVNNVIIRYCHIVGSIEIIGDRSNPAANLTLTSNILGYVELQNAQNVLISNNIIKQGISGTYGNIITNNVFLSKLPNGYYENFRGDNNIAANNIFRIQGSYGMVLNGNNNQFFNNLLAFSNPSYGPNATATGNYTDVALTDIFINQTGDLFDYSHNYHLKTPETYLGTDGTQVGIYGGTHPYKEGAVPSNPHFISATIAPQTNAQGKLEITIKTSAQER